MDVSGPVDGALDPAGRVLLMDLLSAALTLISAHAELVRLKITIRAASFAVVADTRPRAPALDGHRDPTWPA